jgi:hypothetical protein
MTARSLLIPAILAATAALAAPDNALSETTDAQSYAAALLSGTHTPGVKAHYYGNARSASVSSDAHASAAALLTGRSASEQAKTWARIDPPRAVRTQPDAHARAAALLSGSRTRAEESLEVSATAPIGEHPAVLVAKQWHVRGIDPNQFIVAHPARLALDSRSNQ